MCLSVYFIVAWIIFYTHRLKFRSLYNGATQIESHLFLYLLRWYKNDNNNRKMSLVECGREAYLYTKMCERSQSLSQSGQSLIFSLHFLCSVQRYLFNFLFIFFSVHRPCVCFFVAFLWMRQRALHRGSLAKMRDFRPSISFDTGVFVCV